MVYLYQVYKNYHMTCVYISYYPSFIIGYHYKGDRSLPIYHLGDYWEVIGLLRSLDH